MNYTAKDVTIIVTCYKEGELLRRAMASVQAQTVQGFEVIVVNDCSPDPLTDRLCEELTHNSGIRYHRHERNTGLSGARNTGFGLMTGSIALLLDADDELTPNAVADTLATFNAHQGIDMVFGDYAQLTEGRTSTATVISCRPLADRSSHLNLTALAQDWRLLGTSPCTKALWQRTGGYAARYANSVQDVDFWRRAFLSGARGTYTETVIYRWYRAESGMNASVKEEDYLQLRIDSLPFYDRFNSDYAKEMRQYIYRYYAARLMGPELNAFLQLPHGDNFTFLQRLKAKLMHIRPLYVVLRHLHNLVRTAP